MPRSQGRQRGELHFALQGYTPETEDVFIADLVFPTHSVKSDVGFIHRTPLKAMLQRPKGGIKRSPGAESKRMTAGMVKQNFVCEENSHEAAVDWYQEDDAEAQMQSELNAAAINERVLKVEHEAEVADMLFNQTNFVAGTNGVDLGTPWSNGASDPITDVNAGRRATRNKGLYKSNTLIITEKTQEDLSENGAIRDRLNTIFGSDNANVKGSTLSADILARVFSIKNVLIPHIPTDATSMARTMVNEGVWADGFAMLCYVDPNGNVKLPTLGCTFVNSNKGAGGLFNHWSYVEEKIKSDVLVGEQFTDKVLLEKDLGYLMAGVR